MLVDYQELFALLDQYIGFERFTDNSVRLGFGFNFFNLGSRLFRFHFGNDFFNRFDNGRLSLLNRLENGNKVGFFIFFQRKFRAVVKGDFFGFLRLGKFNKLLGGCFAPKILFRQTFLFNLLKLLFVNFYLPALVGLRHKLSADFLLKISLNSCIALL